MNNIADTLNSDKMGVFLKITPRPRLDIEWEIIFAALRGCGINDLGGYKPSNNSVINVEELCPVIFFQIPRKQLLFFEGEVFQAGLCGPIRNEIVIFANYPFDNGDGVVNSDNSGRKYKYTAEIRLTLIPPECDTKKFERIERRKQAKERCCKKWQEIVGWCFQPFKRVFEESVNHIDENPNGGVNGRAEGASQRGTSDVE